MSIHIKIHFNGFWNGFYDNTDCNNLDTFLKLFRKVFGCECTSGTFDESVVLCESVFGQPLVNARQWKYSFLFSGETRLNDLRDSYTVVLWGERNHGNVINFPLFMSYLQYRDRWLMLTGGNEARMTVPSNGILALISNGNSPFRNSVLDKLEAAGVKITYAGGYRNNIGYSLDYSYYSDEQIRFMHGFKFVLAFENKKYETYITEKIVNPLLAQTIPIYYGSEHITDYFNEERFLNIKDDSDESIVRVVEKIRWLCENPTEWLKMVNTPNFGNSICNDNTTRTLNDVARDIKNKIYGSEDHMYGIDRIYCLANPEFEPLRYNTLKRVFSKWGIDDARIKYICPTWKQHITPDVMEKYVKSPEYIRNYRDVPIKPSEISLFLNNIAVYTHIRKNYSDGIFLVVESDIIDGEYFELFPDLMKILNENRDKWDVIFAGSFDKKCMPYAKNFYKSVENPIEDMTDETSFIRIKRGVEWRTAEAYIWNYNSIVKFLDYIEQNTDFKIPYDHYLDTFFNVSVDLKVCWIHSPMFFYQTSIHKSFGSTIQ